MPLNVKLLRRTARALRVSDDILQIVEAVVSDRTWPNRTIMFPLAAPGIEFMGVGRFGDGLHIPVRVNTVDQLIVDNALSRVDVLTIDTEGADPAVLKGSLETLLRVRYLQFEVARHLANTSWVNTEVFRVID